MEKKTLEIQEILYALKKSWKLIVLVTILMGSLAAAYTFLNQKTVYNATVKIFSGKTSDADVYTTGDLTSNSSLMQTYIQLIKTDNFMNKVIEKSEVQTSPDHLKAAVQFSTAGDVPILTIGYTSTNAEVAEKIVSTITTEFEQEVKETILNINTKVIESVKIVPKNPNRVKFIMLGIIAGLILSIGIALVKDYLDNRIKGKDELEKLLPIPVLVEIPKEKKLLK